MIKVRLFVFKFFQLSSQSVFQDGAAIIKNAPAITGGPTAPLVVLGKVSSSCNYASSILAVRTPNSFY